MKREFKPVDASVNFPSLEEEVLKVWEENKIFEKSLEKNRGGKPFIFFEGPPTANGKPGTHHIEARAFKDLFPRYKTMRGFFVERKAGWDCHGLPVELEVEKKLGISGKPDIEKLGVEKFNQLCRESVYVYVSEWEKITKRIGYWVEISSAYETLKSTYIESCWWLLKQMSERGLLYEDYKVVPYCARCGTPLSSHELAQGYKDDVLDPSVFVKFKVKGKEDTFLLAWTTTPWTLPGNVGLAVSVTSDYVTVVVENEKLILAKARLDVLGKDYKVLEEFKGEKLLGIDYEPLYTYVKYDKKAHFVMSADFVSMEDGTGIVHTAVMYGEDDFELGKNNDLPKKHAVNEKGQFVEEVTPWAGMFVKKADPLIIEELASRNLVFKREEVRHTYPFCWRCGTPLLYYAMTSWYLRTSLVKELLIKNNNLVNWIPNHIKNGRMGEWLKNNKDWSLSRSRYWGTPLPIWRCDNCRKDTVVGSVEELSRLSGSDQSQLDLHRPYIDEIIWRCGCGGTFIRVPFVLDCWFDSGAMPYAQWHFPFENEDAKGKLSADYISEAIDQTRGWFYTLQAIAALMGETTAYKNVICLGHVLDEKGLKMSKSKGNIVDPWSVLNEAGADAMRWYFFSVISPGESFNFSIHLVKEVNRRFLLIFWNIYRFFVTNASLKDEWDGKLVKSDNILDKWLLARCDEVIKVVIERMDAYDAYSSTQELENFVNEFSTWYIRRSRDRVGPTAIDLDDKKKFYSTCYQVLTTLCKLLAPFIPFISDEIYRNLTGEESVHLVNSIDTPYGSEERLQIISGMQIVKKICELGNAKRKELGIKVKQPLAKLIVQNLLFMNELEDPFKIHDVLIQLIKDELNVKEVEFVAGKGEIFVEFDTNLTSELIDEGKAREIVRQIQKARKDAGIDLDQMIDVILSEWPDAFVQKIKSETLARTITQGEDLTIKPTD